MEFNLMKFHLILMKHEVIWFKSYFKTFINLDSIIINVAILLIYAVIISSFSTSLLWLIYLVIISSTFVMNVIFCYNWRDHTAVTVKSFLIFSSFSSLRCSSRSFVSLKFLFIKLENYLISNINLPNCVT